MAHLLVADATVGEGTYFAGLIGLLNILATKYWLPQKYTKFNFASFLT